MLSATQLSDEDRKKYTDLAEKDKKRYEVRARVCRSALHRVVLVLVSMVCLGREADLLASTDTAHVLACARRKRWQSTCRAKST